MQTITKDMVIGDLLKMHPLMGNILQREGMGCVTCASSQFESLEEAAAVHGLKIETLVARLNNFMEMLPQE